MWPSPGGNAQLYKVYWTAFESMTERSELGKVIHSVLGDRKIKNQILVLWSLQVVLLATSSRILALFHMGGMNEWSERASWSVLECGLCLVCEKFISMSKA